MEKLQIAKYGMMQVTAIVYGVLLSGAAVKGGKAMFTDGHSMPDGYYYALYFREYGLFLFFIVLGWTAIASYLASPMSRWDFDPDDVAVSGFALAILLALAGSFFAFGGMISLQGGIITGMSDK